MRAIAIALSLLAARPWQGRAVYRNETYGFRVTLPPGWVQLPDSVVRAMLAKTRLNYVAAFGRARPHQTLDYPVVLVQVEDVDPARMPLSLDSLARYLNAMVPAPSGNRVVTRPPAALYARVDSAARAVLLALSPARLADGRLISAYGALRFVRRGVVSLNAYGLTADSAATSAIRAQFLAAFETDSLPEHP